MVGDRRLHCPLLIFQAHLHQGSQLLLGGSPLRRLEGEFPSLSWLDKTEEGALKGIQELVFDTLQDMDGHGH